MLVVEKTGSRGLVTTRDAHTEHVFTQTKRLSGQKQLTNGFHILWLACIAIQMGEYDIHLNINMKCCDI